MLSCGNGTSIVRSPPQKESDMPNVYIEPKPTGRGPADPIDHYVIEHADGRRDSGPYKTQAEAIEAARRAGHSPLVARVRVTNKGNPDHWRSP